MSTAGKPTKPEFEEIAVAGVLPQNPSHSEE
jgi:hypothetical protein